MATERTLSIIKPDAVEKNIIGEIYQSIREGGIKNCGRQDDQADQSSRQRNFTRFMKVNPSTMVWLSL